MKRKGTFRILDESVQTRPDLAPAPPEGDAPDIPSENPYWTWDEQEPHPDPSKGCIRRGLCCKSNPGWFAPGEVEEAAALKGLEPDAFVRKYLVIDAIDVDGELVHVFAPLKLGIDGKPAIPPASRADHLYRALRGQCIFYGTAADGEGGCTIYEARPTECRLYVCTNAPADNPTHEQIAKLWRSGG
jgi:Fe-S-cluster containining protein